MEKHKCFEILLFGFLLLKESSTYPLESIKICSPSLQAQNGQFPHVVSIKTKGEMLCQGTLINVNWVLTSANCINNNNYIPLNDVDLAIGNETPKIKRNPKRVIVQNDITLIEMDKPVIVTSTVAPIELATENLSENIKCIVNSFQKHSNHELTLVYWNMVNISKNEEYDNKEWYILKDIFCHKKIWPLQHIIDNGSPLICNNHLYGIYSINKPKVFNSILNYNKWIQNEIESNSTTWEAIEIAHMNTEDTVTTETEYPTSQYTKETPIYSVTTPKPTTFTQKSSKSTTGLVKSTSIITVTEDINETESDDPTFPDTDETPIYSTPISTPTAYTQKPSKGTTEIVKSTSINTATEDIYTTESDDPTSPDTEETPIYSTTTPKPTTSTQKPSKGTTELVKSTSISTPTEDIVTTESDDPTSPDTEETPIYSVTTPNPTTSTQKSSKGTTELFKSTSINTVTEDINETESDDPTSPDTNETLNYFAPTSPYTQNENNSTTKSSDKSTTEIYVSELEDMDEIETDALSSKPDYDNETFISTIISSFSTTKKYTSDTITINGTNTDVTEETEDSQFSNNPYIITTEHSTTEDSTLNPNTSTNTFNINDTDETEDGQFSVKSTSEIKTTTAITITSTIVDSTLNPNTSMNTFDINDTDETEDGQFTVKSTSEVKTTTAVTKTSTLVDSTLSPIISTVTARKTDETDETEDDQFSELPSSTDIVVTTNMDQSSETEDLLPIDTTTTTVLTTIIPSTKTATNTIEPSSISTSISTVPPSITTVPSSITTVPPSITTVPPSIPTTPKTAAPSISATTQISDILTPKTTSSSRIVSFSTSLITIVCCILYYINL